MSIPHHCEERSEAAIQNAGRNAGLPRFARNDGTPRASAPLREPQLLFDSRKGAKARRIDANVFECLGAIRHFGI